MKAFDMSNVTVIKSRITIVVHHCMAILAHYDRPVFILAGSEAHKGA